MANIKISELNEIETISIDDVLPIVDTSATETKKVEINNLIRLIVESGSNANGNYIKYADGTMICYGSREFTNININTVWGSVYESAKYNLGSLPATFISKPEVFINTRDGSSCFAEALSPTTTALGETWFWSPITRSGVDFTISFIAIGKWK